MFFFDTLGMWMNDNSIHNKLMEVFILDRLKDKVVIVTGSTSGIGIGIAKLCAKEAAQVVVTGRNAERGQKVVDEIAAEGGKAWFHAFDLTDNESMHTLIADVAEKFGRIDVLINNAAGMGMKDGRVDELSLEEFNAVVATDLGGTFNMIKEVLPYLMKNENGGNIIIYPEGYWNLDDDGLSDERHNADDHNSENWLIQDINIGVVRLAQETGCPIVPTILHYDETIQDICYSKKGDSFYVSKDDDIFAKKDELVEKMTTIYFGLMEKYSSYKRSYLERNGVTLKEQWETLKQKLVSACDIDSIGYKLDLQNEKLIGKAKVVNTITTNKEAFEHLNDLDINENNAFLLSKRLSGRKR